MQRQWYGIYPCEWKKVKVVPIHKKGDKHKKTIFHCLNFQFAVKYLKDTNATRCLVSFLIKT